MFRIFAALGCALALIVSTAFAATPPREAALDRTMAYLERVQNADGGFGARPGAESDPAFSAWVAYAFAAAGTNPFDRSVPGGTDAFTYLAAHASELTLTTDWERVLLVAIAAGAPARDVGGVDLVARILERRLPDGSFAHAAGEQEGGVNDTAFAVLALSGVDDPAARAVIDPALDWLIAAQREDGAWGYKRESGFSSDMTGAVIQALVAGGRKDVAAIPRGFEYLRTLQAESGGFAASEGEEPNVASTAWAVQAMWAAGTDPGHALDFLASMQQADGSIRWSAREDTNPVWMSAQVAPAFAGHPLPLPRVPRAEKPTPTPTPTASATPAPTVKAGGGGAGAPLFSQPKPQSQGRDRGGVRETRQGRVKPRATATPRPGTSPAAGTPRAGTAAPQPAASPAPATDPAVTVTPTATPSPVGGGASGDGSGPSLASAPPAGTASAGGDSALPYVRGTIVSTNVNLDEVAAAPGLAGFDHDETVAARLIAAALLIALAIGWMFERRTVVA